MEPQNKNAKECCPPFNPALWDDKISEWENKLFLRDKVCTFFYIPVNFGQTMKNLDARVRAAGANFAGELCLCEHTSKWNMNILLGVDREIPGSDNTTLSGKFYSKVYEGSFGQTGKWHKDFETIIKTKGYIARKYYTWYTTCPKCAKKYGKNYVVILAQID